MSSNFTSMFCSKFKKKASKQSSCFLQILFVEVENSIHYLYVCSHLLKKSLMLKCSFVQCEILSILQISPEKKIMIVRGGSRAAATSKMECFAIIVSGFQSLTIITKHSILDVAAVLDLPLIVWHVTLLRLYPNEFLHKFLWGT